MCCYVFTKPQTACGWQRHLGPSGPTLFQQGHPEETVQSTSSTSSRRSKHCSLFSATKDCLACLNIANRSEHFGGDCSLGPPPVHPSSILPVILPGEVRVGY